MIEIRKPETFGWEGAIRGMRNPMNSWKRSDSKWSEIFIGFELGENDLDLCAKLISAGPEHRKFLRMIRVQMDITAPLYWWKEFDTYKVGTVANSCSTMHRIHAKEFSLEDFSTEHLTDESIEMLEKVILWLNGDRREFIRTKNKLYWWQMIQLLPSSYNQKRTVDLNYETLMVIYKQRKNHKLDEWRTFCEAIKCLPYMEDFLFAAGEALEEE